MKMKITVMGVEYEVEVEVLDDAGYPVKNPAVPQISPMAVSPHPTSSAQVTPASTASAINPAGSRSSANGILAPVSGTIISVNCKAGDSVKRGDVLITLEAMKMETNVASDREATIKSVHVKAGDNIREGQSLIEFA